MKAGGLAMDLGVATTLGLLGEVTGVMYGPLAMALYYTEAPALGVPLSQGVGAAPVASLNGTKPGGVCNG